IKMVHETGIFVKFDNYLRYRENYICSNLSDIFLDRSDMTMEQNKANHVTLLSNCKMLYENGRTCWFTSEDMNVRKSGLHMHLQDKNYYSAKTMSKYFDYMNDLDEAVLEFFTKDYMKRESRVKGNAKDLQELKE